jgi:hypothetical protein
MRSISFLRKSKFLATSRHLSTDFATSPITSFASFLFNLKFSATDNAVSNEAESLLKSIAVVRILGFISVGVGLRS